MWDGWPRLGRLLLCGYLINYTVRNKWRKHTIHNPTPLHPYLINPDWSWCLSASLHSAYRQTSKIKSTLYHDHPQVRYNLQARGEAFEAFCSRILEASQQLEKPMLYSGLKMSYDRYKTPEGWFHRDHQHPSHIKQINQSGFSEGWNRYLLDFLLPPLEQAVVIRLRLSGAYCWGKDTKTAWITRSIEGFDSHSKLTC